MIQQAQYRHIDKGRRDGAGRVEEKSEGIMVGNKGTGGKKG
jgi:hypothetical protein